MKSHHLKLQGLIHNESQDGKTELDSSFFHFKLHLKKYMNHYKTSILTPQDMARAMEYASGVKNFRFDIVEFNRTHLDLLFDSNDKYYGALKNRIKQVLPSNIAEIRTTEEGIHLLYQSSALQPFKFDNGIVKKLISI